MAGLLAQSPPCTKRFDETLFIIINVSERTKCQWKISLLREIAPGAIKKGGNDGFYIHIQFLADGMKSLPFVIMLFCRISLFLFSFCLIANEIVSRAPVLYHGV
jgi:hypothetical protein